MLSYSRGSSCRENLQCCGSVRLGGLCTDPWDKGVGKTTHQAASCAKQVVCYPTSYNQVPGAVLADSQTRTILNQPLAVFPPTFFVHRTLKRSSRFHQQRGWMSSAIPTQHLSDALCLNPTVSPKSAKEDSWKLEQ